MSFPYFSKELHIDQGSNNCGGGYISAIMHMPYGIDVKNKADDTVTVNKGHSTASEDSTQLLSEIRQCAVLWYPNMWLCILQHILL